VVSFGPVNQAAIYFPARVICVCFRKRPRTKRRVGHEVLGTKPYPGGRLQRAFIVSRPEDFIKLPGKVGYRLRQQFGWSRTIGMEGNRANGAPRLGRIYLPVAQDVGGMSNIACSLSNSGPFSRASPPDMSSSEAPRISLLCISFGISSGAKRRGAADAYIAFASFMASMHSERETSPLASGAAYAVDDSAISIAGMACHKGRHLAWNFFVMGARIACHWPGIPMPSPSRRNPVC